MTRGSVAPQNSVVETAGIKSVRNCVELPTRWLWTGDETMIERNTRLFAPSFNDARFAFFTIRSRGHIVSSAILFSDPQEGAGIYAVPTPPEERGKGYGGMATRACVEEARRRGFEKIALYATALGESVYQKIGFRTVGMAVNWRVGC